MENRKPKNVAMLNSHKIKIEIRPNMYQNSVDLPALKHTRGSNKRGNSKQDNTQCSDVIQNKEKEKPEEEEYIAYFSKIFETVGKEELERFARILNLKEQEREEPRHISVEKYSKIMKTLKRVDNFIKENNKR